MTNRKYTRADIGRWVTWHGFDHVAHAAHIVNVKRDIVILEYLTTIGTARAYVERNHQQRIQGFDALHGGTP